MIGQKNKSQFSEEKTQSKKEKMPFLKTAGEGKLKRVVGFDGFIDNQQKEKFEYRKEKVVVDQKKPMR